MSLPDALQFQVFKTSDPHITKHTIHFPIIHRNTAGEQRVQDRDQVFPIAYNQKILSVSCRLCMEKKRERGCKWIWGIWEHSVCAEAVQLVRLI
jgi:hypothetical protein